MENSNPNFPRISTCRMANDAVNKYAPYSLKKKKEDAPYMEKIAIAFFY